jgi:hypothetical protein
MRGCYFGKMKSPIINIVVGSFGEAGGAAISRILMLTNCELSLGLKIVLGEMESEMVEFEAEWSKRCKDLEEIELSPHEAITKKLEFEMAEHMLKVHLLTFDLEEFNKRMKKVEWDVDISLTKAKTNFRNNETKRLRKAWGPIAGFIYFVKSKLGFY